VDNTIWHPRRFLPSVSNYIFWNDLEFRFHTKSMLCYVILENPLVLFYLLLPTYGILTLFIKGDASQEL